MPDDKAKEHSPREALAMYQAVLDNFPNGSVVLFDKDKRYLLAGGDALGRVGLSPEALVGRTIHEVFQEDMAGFLDDVFSRTLAGESLSMEVEYQDDVYQLNTRQVLDVDGTTIAGMAITQRITERIRRERLVHERQEVYRNLVDNSPDIIARFDRNLRILFINETVSRYGDRPIDEYFGLGLHEFGLPEEEIGKLAEGIRRVFDTGREVLVEVFISRSQPSLTFDVRLAPELDVRGKVESVMAVARDLSGLFALEREKKRLLELVEATPDIVYTMDDDGKLLYCNSAARQMLLIPGQADLSQWSMSDIHPPEYQGFLKNEALPQALREGIWTGESHMLCREGSHIAVKQTIIAQKGDNGNTPIFSVIAHDLSKLKAQEQDLREAKERAEAASRGKSEFLANMSHEIRTPISGILGMAELLLKDPTMRLGRDKLEMISQAGQSLLGIVNDILDLNKLEAKGIEIVNEPFPIQRMAESLEDLFEHQAKAKGLGFSINISDNLPLVLMGDEQRISQVLRNLISNAIKFTNSGSVSLSITPETTKDGRHTVYFGVRDTGVGIPGDKQGKLFTNFTQLDSSYSKQHGGTGLGLAISKNFVELMGGRLEVTSRPGEGSTFSFSLPLATPTSQQEREVMGTAPTIRKKQGKILNVLAVDDNSINRMFLQGILDEAGHDSYVAKDALEALEILEDPGQDPFDCIIMDIQLPGMDGVEATRLIRASGKPHADTPVIALTAYAMEGDRERFLDAGMDEYVAKPVEGPELLDAMHRVIESRATTQETTQATTGTDVDDLSEKEERNLRTRLATLQQSRMLYNEFLLELDVKKEAMRRAMDKEHHSELAHLAHSLGGAAGVLGLLELLALCRSIDAKVTTRNQPLEESDLENLLRHIDAAAKAVRKLQKEHGAEG